MSFDVAPARAIAEAHMPQTLEVLGKGARIPDGMGGFKSGAETVTATYPCRLSGLGGSESVVADQLQATVEGQVRLPVGAAVHAASRVRIDGDLYEVVHVVPKAEAYAAQKVILVTGASA